MWEVKLKKAKIAAGSGVKQSNRVAKARLAATDSGFEGASERISAFHPLRKFNLAHDPFLASLDIGFIRCLRPETCQNISLVQDDDSGDTVSCSGLATVDICGITPPAAVLLPRLRCSAEATRPESARDDCPSRRRDDCAKTLQLCLVHVGRTRKAPCTNRLMPR